MADLQQFAVTVQGNASVTVPRFQMTGKVVDGDGAVLFDFTGASAINFPADLVGKLTAQDRQDFIDLVKFWLVQRVTKKFG